MKMYKYTVRAIACIFMLALVLACNEDFGEVGTGIVGETNFQTNVTEAIDVVAYSKSFNDGVQTNALPAGAFGVYRDNIYGTTSTSVISQVFMSRTDPEFGENPVLDSVFFTLPYFSTLEETDEDGNSTYTLDSIFGNTGPMKLSIYRSNFFLNSLDPDSNFEDAQMYFSNEIENFSGIEGDLLFEIEDFEPSADEIVLTTLEVLPEDAPEDQEPENEVSERLAPALRVKLDSLYFAQNIIEREGDEVLLNQNNFNDYFRGIYIKAEPVNGTGSYIIFDYAGASLTAFYSFEGDDDSGEPGEPTDDGSGNISFGIGNAQSVYAMGIQNNFNPQIVADINQADTENGEDNLYLKGGDGSIAIIDLFGPDFDNDGIEDQLELLRSCNVIINEANLTFYVDQDEVAPGSGVAEPERVFIYDFDNNRTLLDGDPVIDPSVGFDGPVNTRINHLGRLTREIDGDQSSPGKSYRIRITQHINDIVNNDSTDVRLALAVSQNVQTLNSAVIGETADTDEVRNIPVSTVISPEGTILHGNLSANEAKRLKLRLYYTIAEEIDPDSPCGRLLGLE